MNVQLAPELEKIVNKKIETGAYNSAAEVIEEALRLMLERDEEIRAQVAEGYASLERGGGIDGEEAFCELDQRRRLDRDRQDQTKVRE